MNTIKLGGQLETSLLGLGCMRQCRVEETQARENFYAALDLGIRFFDHADVYGFGASETLYGRLLAADPGVRSHIHLQSKCALIRDAEKTLYLDTSKAHIIASAEESLKRLQTDYLDVYLLHHPDTLMEPDEIAEAFDQLHAAGKVRYFGVSNFNRAEFDYLQSILGQKLIVNQLQVSAAHTELIDSGNAIKLRYDASEDHNGGVLAYCRQHGVTIQVWSPLQAHFYGGTFMGHPDFPTLNSVVDRIANEQQVSSAAVGIAWLLRHPAHFQPLLGTTNPQHLKEMAQGLAVSLDRSQWYEIYRASLTDSGKILVGNSNHQK